MPGLSRSGNWNENDANILSRINWRASLVPAAAVIPAPIAYIKVVAVKKLVVEFLVEPSCPSLGVGTWLVLCPPWLELAWHLVVVLGTVILYCEEIRVFKAGLGLEYISME
jgi:hypothetical protein